jgi:hypothetical protein
VFDDGSLTLRQQAGISFALYGQLTFKHAEFLYKSAMAVFSHHSHAN